jgi:hypothetical protein
MGVMDVAGTMQHIEHLAGLGDHTDLAEHPERLVTQEELRKVVWSTTSSVTDCCAVTCADCATCSAISA